MLDITLMRKDVGAAAERLRARGFEFDVAAFNALEAERKAVQTHTEELQARRNALSKQIGALKRKGEDASAVMAEVGAIPDQIKSLRGELGEHPGATCTRVARRAQPAARLGAGRRGRARTTSRCAAGGAAHVRLRGRVTTSTSARRWASTSKAAAKISGARFTFMRGPVARLHRALAQFMLDVQTRRARLHRVLHAVHRQRANADRHRPAAEVRAGPVRGAQGRRRKATATERCT